MEPTRTRAAVRIKSTTPYVKPEKRETIYTDDERNTITELKKLYLETINLDVALQRDIYNMEKSYEDRHNVIFEKRKKIIEDFRKQTHGDSTPNENVSNFWLKVLKASYTEFISKKDEKILSTLVDVRSRLYNDPEVKFDIEFHFDKNEYFTNSVLKKTYFLNCLPDPKDPLSYDGAEIYKCEGCTIDWKTPKSGENSSESDNPSFFNFFSPPTVPADPENEYFCDVNAILQNDFELGFYLKERVIPKAVIFFTGEIADCQSTSESDSENTDDDSDAEEEDESSNGTDK